MIEKLIHTPEGELRPDDPFRTIGTRGYYLGSREFRWIVTEKSIETSKNIIDTALVRVHWLPRQKELEVIGNNASITYKKTALEIVTPENDHYFEVKGY